MDLNEIYYVDEKRLSHYVDQIERSPKTSDKGSKFKIELGWPPKLGWEQTRDVRERTTTEKIEIVRNYLEKTEQCSWQRPDREEEWSPFVLEYVRVTKVIVPSSAEKALNTPGFIFWLAVGSEEDCGGTLCLLEDFRRADEPPTNFRSASTYTVRV